MAAGMTIANVAAQHLAAEPNLASQYRNSSYDSPFSFAVGRQRVLIVGGGADNDAAAALRNGADHVDAVEIDPLIYSLGKRLHPERLAAAAFQVTARDHLAARHAAAGQS